MNVDTIYQPLGIFYWNIVNFTMFYSSTKRKYNYECVTTLEKIYLFFYFNRKENDGYYMLQANKTTIRTSYFKHPDFTRNLCAN